MANTNILNDILSPKLLLSLQQKARLKAYCDIRGDFTAGMGDSLRIPIFPTFDAEVGGVAGSDIVGTNIVIDDLDFFGNTAAANTTAEFSGVAGLSSDKIKVQFKLVMNGGNATANAFWYAGQGYISSVAPTVSPDAPVWVSPMSIAVDGPLVPGKNGA
jgi:hypothetical protein